MNVFSATLRFQEKRSCQNHRHPQKNTPILMCNEHGVAEHECAICHPDLASGLKPGEALKINLASNRSAEKSWD